MTYRNLGVTRAALASLLLAACGAHPLVNQPDAAVTPDASPFAPEAKTAPDATVARPMGWSLRDEAPHGRLGHAAVIDEGADRMIVHGGSANDTWALPLSGPEANRWKKLTPEGEYPQPLAPNAAIYDPFNKRMLLLASHGSSGPNEQGDVQFWELSLEGALRWRRIQLPGSAPGLDFWAGKVVLDRAGKRAIVVGGTGTWAFDLTAPRWTRIADGPFLAGALDRAACAMDPRRNRILVFDGENLVSALDLTTGSWDFLIISNGATTFGTTAAATDEDGDRVVLVGALGSGISTLSLSTNQKTGLPSPSGRHDGASAVADRKRGRVLLFSGVVPASGPAGDPQGELVAATWSLPLDTLELEELVPAKYGADYPLAGANVVWDPARQMVIAFGTPDAGQDYYATWGHGLADGDGWQHLPLPAASLAGHAAAIYDPVRRAIVSFGGLQHIDRDGILRLSAEPGATWESLSVANGPIERSRHLGVYDAARRRLVIFGGARYSYPNVLNDTWALSLDGDGAWSRLNATGTPPPTPVAALGVYDAPRERLLFYGGNDGRGPETGTTLYALSLGDAPAWIGLATQGVSPAGLERSSAAYEAARERMIIVDLRATGAIVYALDLAAPTPTWHRFCAPGLRPAGNDWASNAVLVPDGLFVSAAGGAFRFNLDTPYCD